MSTGQEDDQVLLRDDLAPGRPQLIVYSDDNSVGCAGWCCCAMGVLTLTVLFFVSVLPTLEESWQWVAEDCYVYAHTSFPAVSALVTLAGSPDCHEDRSAQGERPTFSCEKRTRSIMYSEARDTGDAELWLLIHKVGESRTCYDNPSTNVTRFDAPPNLMAGVATGVTIVMGFTCTFFIAGSLCICVFLNPTSSANRVLSMVGIHRKAMTTDEEQGTTLQNLGTGRSSQGGQSSSGGGLNERSASYDDLLEANGILMDFDQSTAVNQGAGVMSDERPGSACDSPPAGSQPQRLVDLVPRD